MTKPLPPALRFMRVASSPTKNMESQIQSSKQHHSQTSHHDWPQHGTPHRRSSHILVKEQHAFFLGGGIDALISSVASYTNRRAPPHQNRIPLKNAHTSRRPKPEKQKKEMICINLPGSLQALSTRAIARLGDNLDDSTGFLDLLLGQLGDESGLDDERLVDSALAELEMWEKEQNILSVAVDRTRGRGGRRLTSLCLLS